MLYVVPQCRQSVYCLLTDAMHMQIAVTSMQYYMKHAPCCFSMIRTNVPDALVAMDGVASCLWTVNNISSRAPTGLP